MYYYIRYYYTLFGVGINGELIYINLIDIFIKKSIKKREKKMPLNIGNRLYFNSQQLRN